MSFTTQAQIVNIPDANFKARLLSASPSNGIAGYCSSAGCVYGTSAISYITIDTNGDNEIQVSECQAVEFLNLNSSNINSLIGIEAFSNLKVLYSDNNNLTNINVSGLLNLNELFCGNNQLTNLNVNSCLNLQKLLVSNNQLTSIDVSSLSDLKELYVSFNQLSNLDVTNLQNLYDLACSFNNLTSLNLSQNPILISLFCEDNQLTTLDITNNPNIYSLWCSNNLLNSMFVKNNGEYIVYFIIDGNPNLQYICADDNDLAYIQQITTQLNYVNCHVNSYCSFNPNGTFYEIEGNAKLDSNSNGCDISDIDYPNLNLSITDGTNSGTFISNTSGNYSIPVQTGSHTITPVLENPTYFNISPTSFIANFSTQTSPLIQDFCVTANGVHHDVEVTFIPTNPARPGFDTNYTIIYKNKGNQIENGAVTLDFNDAVLDLVSANPTTNNQQPSTLTWNYTNLQPLETRIINLVFNVNSPTENPAVNIGDVLNYTASITPLTTDEFISDNTSTLNQTVVGSYDPNDKTCIEGTTVGPDMIGQYVHYVIRFENTGTYPAENIVVKDLIDLSKFDVATLIPLHSSHDFVTRIAGNKVEFIFEGINLPFDDANNDGYVAFKIKTKSNLVVGDTFSNDANIYFDYNFPITTNTFTTTIQVLKVKDFEFGTHFTLYPNPVKDVLNLQSKDNTAINSIEIYNILGQVVLAVPNAISTVDVSNLQSGNYFVKVNTDLGVSNTKFIKE